MRFYGVIVGATFVGVILDWSNLNPIKALFWSAVLNGIAAVPIMAAMMVVASSRRIMGPLHERPILLGFGWAATLVMALAAVAMIVASLTG
jgi:Natural resistance-associated macrophage protein.